MLDLLSGYDNRSRVFVSQSERPSAGDYQIDDRTLTKSSPFAAELCRSSPRTCSTDHPDYNMNAECEARRGKFAWRAMLSSGNGPNSRLVLV
jgi:hypothetical protein